MFARAINLTVIRKAFFPQGFSAETALRSQQAAANRHYASTIGHRLPTALVKTVAGKKAGAAEKFPKNVEIATAMRDCRYGAA